MRGATEGPAAKSITKLAPQGLISEGGTRAVCPANAPAEITSSCG
jgi:hypothetical protein